MIDYQENSEIVAFREPSDITVLCLEQSTQREFSIRHPPPRERGTAAPHDGGPVRDVASVGPDLFRAVKLLPVTRSTTPVSRATSRIGQFEDDVCELTTHLLTQLIKTRL